MPQQSRKREPTKRRAIPKHNNNNPTESRNPITENLQNKKKMISVFVKFKGLSCKGSSLPASTPAAIILSAAEWEAKRSRNHNQKRKKTNQNIRNQENVVVDIPDVCCAPPGIGIASDFAPRARHNIAPKSDHRKLSREARRNEADFPTISSSVRASRTNNHQSAREIIEMMMSQQPMLSGRHDRYRGWRLDVDDMSYEELLELSDKIGYVGSGLQEEEIFKCLRKSKHFNFDSTSLLVADQKDWKCSICQEKCKKGDDIGTLNCGHHHHIQCIKQWLLHKNACPVCKSAVVLDRSN